MTMIASITPAPQHCWTQWDDDKRKECLKLCVDFNVSIEQDLILINVTTQTLHHLKYGKWIGSYIISSGSNGIGQKKGSGQTPLGLHIIESKIGDGEHSFAVFKGRVPTGEIAKSNEGGDLIVGRILRLRGVQPGFNQGNDVDSYERFIYIHGTNEIAWLGRPASAGCIRMHPKEIVDFFDRIPAGTPVLIYTQTTTTIKFCAS